MNQWLLTQLDYLLRIVVAASCGAAIGYERENRLKTAGIRTHIIVSIGSSIMMIVSKYGFFDVILHSAVNLDPSRIAAGVVTAIGFLGAGVIVVRDRTVSGLTTAAGVWTTVGIGIAIGAGMYFIGVVSAVLIVLLQMLLHGHFSILKAPAEGSIVLFLDGGESAVPSLTSLLGTRRVQTLNTSIRREKDGGIEVRLQVRFHQEFDMEDMLTLLRDEPNIRLVELG